MTASLLHVTEPSESAVDVAADAWVARFGSRPLPPDRDALATVLMDEALDDVSLVMDALRDAAYEDLAAAVSRRQQGDA